jgi:Pyridoxamine 5'-phosphate oxidase
MALEISDHVAQAVNGARDKGRPIVLAYVNEDGYPSVSTRGSTHVYGPQQLAIWGRNPDGGLQKAIASNPKVGLLAFDMDPFTLLFFNGRARLDPSQNDVVWEKIPQGEKDLDPERKGGAIIIDLDSIKGLEDGNFFAMSRD